VHRTSGLVGISKRFKKHHSKQHTGGVASTLGTGCGAGLLDVSTVSAQNHPIILSE